MSETQLEGLEAQVERRQNRRFACDFQIIIEWGAAELRGRVTDISYAGMFVELENPLWIGARFAAQLAFAQPIPLECVVRGVRPRRGMALTFATLSESSRTAIDSLLQGYSGQ